MEKITTISRPVEGGETNHEFYAGNVFLGTFSESQLKNWDFRQTLLRAVWKQFDIQPESHFYELAMCYLFGAIDRIFQPANA
ncbi:MAG TPA: hypothetical protein VK892_20940 [Pyrinomonadaceae bacterium]|nr:hypothetical protein [Pyrinomonadaceae bacterium]